jgi:fermentation-respiration switch protein FrsA (DUF1100 family)
MRIVLRRAAPFLPVLVLFCGTLAVLAAIALAFASLTLFLGQRYLLFGNASYVDIRQPSTVEMGEIRSVKVQTADGLPLSMWYKKAHGACPTIVDFHGAGGDVKSRAFKMEPFLHAGWGALFVEYRGYGGNPGRPTERGISEDARAAVHHLAAEGLPPGQAVFVGESLGSGVAVKAAVEFQPAALVLEAPYTSITDVAKTTYWFLPVRLLNRDVFPSIDRIANLKSPLLIIHGEADKVIPVELARRLLDAAPAPKRGIFIPGAGHANLFAMGAVDAISAFVTHDPQCTPDREAAQ